MYNYMNGVRGQECEKGITYLSSLFYNFVNAHVFISNLFYRFV